MFQVQRDGKFVPRSVQPEGLVSLLDHRPVADGVGSVGRLDLDHLGAVVAEDRGRERGGDHRARVNDTNALERGIASRGFVSPCPDEFVEIVFVHGNSLTARVGTLSRHTRGRPREPARRYLRVGTEVKRKTDAEPRAVSREARKAAEARGRMEMGIPWLTPARPRIHFYRRYGSF